MCYKLIFLQITNCNAQQKTYFSLDIFEKIRSGEIVKKDFNFDKDVVSSYFITREKLYKMKTGSVKNMEKEYKQIKKEKARIESWDADQMIFDIK